MKFIRDPLGKPSPTSIGEHARPLTTFGNGCYGLKLMAGKRRPGDLPDPGEQKSTCASVLLNQ
jgi:hypothetical protein